jgi:hypothetical protein
MQYKFFSTVPPLLQVHFKLTQSKWFLRTQPTASASVGVSTDRNRGDNLKYTPAVDAFPHALFLLKS